MNSIETILLTGGSGFLGKSIIPSLIKKYQVISLGRTPVDNCKNILLDLKEGTKPLPKVDIVIHAAGKAHMVPTTQQEKDVFFDVNVKGTKHLLAGLEASPPQSFIFISTVAVYGTETGEEITEDAPLSAIDPYGQSKVVAEQLILDWGRKNDIKVGILRLPLLVGKNAPGNFGAMVNAINKGRYLNIDKGNAKKSMLLSSDVAAVIDPLSIRGGTYNLTDGRHPTFAELSSAIASTVGRKRIPSIPYRLAKTISRLGDLIQSTTKLKFPLNSSQFVKMTSSLTFSNDKAKKELDWSPTDVLEAIPNIL